MKKFKVDGGVKLCFKKGNCEIMLDFKDLPLHYQKCNASNENMPFQGKCLLDEFVDILFLFSKFLMYFQLSMFLFDRCEL